MKVVILGDGLLGKELKNQTGWDSISRKTHKIDFNDVTSCYQFIKEYDVIINCIAHTDTYDKDKETHWAINYNAVSRLSDWCTDNNKKLVQISTDYVYANASHAPSELSVPVHGEHWYGYTKLLGDAYVQLRLRDYLLIRSTHKEEPFPYEKAWINQVGNFDYVSEIAKLQIELIRKNVSGVFNVGTELKTMYDLAKRTNSNVILEFEIFNETTPTNLIMDISKLKGILK